MNNLNPALIRRVVAKVLDEILGWHFTVVSKNGIITIDEHGYKYSMTEKQFNEALNLIQCN
jgi:hypothetical protein